MMFVSAVKTTKEDMDGHERGIARDTQESRVWRDVQAGRECRFKYTSVNASTMP